MKFSREEKAKRLADWRQSGKSAWAYAKENGICPQTFLRWVNPRKKKKNSFVEVSGKVLPSVESTREVLIEKGDIKIHIPLSVWTSGSKVIMEGLKAAL
jgi:transposase-like protein